MISAYDPHFKAAGEKYQLPWQLLKAQAFCESHLDPNAVSSAGARGLAQFMPATWKWALDLARPTDDALSPHDRPEDPRPSIFLQAWYMRRLLNQFGTITRALAAYNWGPGNVRRMIDTNGHRFKADRLPAETENYIVRVFDVFYRLISP